MRRVFSSETTFITNAVSLYKMRFLRVLFVIIANTIANPVPDYPFSAFSPLYIDPNFEVPSSIINPLPELDASKIQPLGLTNAPDIAQNTQSPPIRPSDDSYIEYEAQYYRSFPCGEEKSVCCLEESIESQGSIILEKCSMSIPPFLPFYSRSD